MVTSSFFAPTHFAEECIDAPDCTNLKITSKICNSFQSVREKCKKSCGVCEDEGKCRGVEDIGVLCRFIPEMMKRCPKSCAISKPSKS